MAFFMLNNPCGRVSINTVYTHLLENTYTADPDNPQVVTDTLGVFGFPEWKGVTRFNYERGPLWQATNLNKRDVTLDLSSAAGRDCGVTDRSMSLVSR